MKSLTKKKVLISGASIAGLSTAYWMNRLGYSVTVVEIANAPRMGGTAVDIRGKTVDVVKRMGIFQELQSNALQLKMISFKNADNETVNSIMLNTDGPSDEIEIERSKLVSILFENLKNDIAFIFNNSVTALSETRHDIKATFKDGSQQEFDLVFGCDGTHSGIRKIWFGNESEYAHFLEAYFSISIVDKLLIEQNTMQFYNVPGKAYMLNAYKNKTDIIFCFLSEKEIPYDYRDTAQQKQIILEQFSGQGWRTAELLEEVAGSKNFYFDKFCQVKMPSWTKGRVALVGDAAYCASPAAGMGGSLAIEGAAALADALQKHEGNFELAFQDYNKNLRPFIDEVQAEAEFNVREKFIPRTEEAIRKRNLEGF
ncbi:FAD-dependent monooxygenase [Chitinophaga filiformis]|uniref:FAD-dependent monooxygenase n=1 Tax=Chitinophaga filiformis TaxID=104663 RepID=A0ABY4HXM5_CHIFI|nr:FAD-dependent monooxygenase [Chitinophaga filiformis]UPK68350.1 FAD-dependent monooxygenase [Chitinophaga filiformis]